MAAYTNIDDPSAHFQTATYTGNGSTQSITNDGNSDLQPDWVWVKNRGATNGLGYQHQVYDTNRGVHKKLMPSVANAESTDTTALTAFNTDGFSTSSNVGVNENAVSHVAWQWKANGGTTSTNTNGTITSTVQANTDAGFNIVTYTGNGANSNFAHGMSEQPDMVIVKNRTSSANWCVWHKDLTSSYYLQLDTDTSEQSGPWDGLDPNSGVVFIYSGGLVNASGSNYVAYIFKGKQGYSKFGKYVGNGSTDGPFVYTGFKPAFIMVKSTSASGSWRMWDSARNPFNLTDNSVHADLPTAENAHGSDEADILSNGFKARNTGSWHNASGVSYIYMAFAENPFVTSTGTPATAR